MSEHFLSMVAAGLALLVFLWALIRSDIRFVGEQQHPEEPVEPGWTEELTRDDERSYGRAFSVHDGLMDADARGRQGELDGRG